MFPSCIQCLCNLYFHISKDMHQLPCFYFSFFYLHKVFPICIYTICNCIVGAQWTRTTVDRRNVSSDSSLRTHQVVLFTFSTSNEFLSWTRVKKLAADLFLLSKYKTLWEKYWMNNPSIVVCRSAEYLRTIKWVGRKCLGELVFWLGSSVLAGFVWFGNSVVWLVNFSLCQRSWSCLETIFYAEQRWAEIGKVFG